jgi:hypothetical protein
MAQDAMGKKALQLVSTNSQYFRIDGSFNSGLPFDGSFSDFQNLHGDDLSQCIGAWGSITDDDTTSVWAVLNHNSEFGAIPGPSTCSLLGLGATAEGREKKRGVKRKGGKEKGTAISYCGV